MQMSWSNWVVNSDILPWETYWKSCHQTIASKPEAYNESSDDFLIEQSSLDLSYGPD
jgi:hypothetical protein